jgi:hypothetical protein
MMVPFVNMATQARSPTVLSCAEACLGTVF